MSMPKTSIQILKNAAKDPNKTNFINFCALYAPAFRTADMMEFREFIRNAP